MQVDGHELRLDEDGYLEDPDDWSPQVARALAAAEGIELQDAHWEIIEQLRHFYAEFGLSPSMRPLVRFLRRELGPDKSGSLYLLGLFPGNPALLGCRIAGLPRPENCF
jgi:tRNA 2-thiouridine synthesizing protein E